MLLVIQLYQHNKFIIKLQLHSIITISQSIYSLFKSSMYRPPRPLTKSNKAQLGLQCISADPTKVIKPARPFHIIVSRFNSQQISIGKSGFKYAQKKTQDSQNNFGQIFPTVLISPKIQLDYQTSKDEAKTNKNTSNSFKIRYLSSHGRRSKQNVQPNQNKITIQNQNINVNNHPKSYSSQQKKYRKNSQDKVSILQTDSFIENTNQQKLRQIAVKTGVIKMKHTICANNNINLNKTSFVIPQSLFDELVLSSDSLNKLKMLVTKAQIIECSMILCLSSNRNIKMLQETLQNQKINISYLIWNAQKYVESFNVLNLSKIEEIQNFIIITDPNSISKNFFISGGVQNKTKFLYLNMNDICELLQFVKTAKINNDYEQNICSITYQRYQQKINITSQFIFNPQLQHKLKILKNNSKNKLTTSFSQSQLFKNTQKLKQFDEQYRNKLVQLAKILHKQSKPQSQQSNRNGYSNNNYQNRYNYYNNNNNQYMKLSIAQQISDIMNCYVSSNTAYQFVSQIVRNNTVNCKQILEFRQKMKNVAFEISNVNNK